MTSEQHAELLRQQDRDRAGEAWQITADELDAMAENYWYEETALEEANGDVQRTDGAGRDQNAPSDVER